MKREFSPKQVARAIGASESSLKRWCDQGLLKMTKTVGGHRRIALDDIFTFLRTQNRVLESPDILGLPISGGRGERVIERARQKLLDSIRADDEASCRRIALDLYAAGHSVATICDEVIAATFHQIGDDWSCGKLEIYQERRGCEIAHRMLDDLFNVVSRPTSEAPLTIGCSVSRDYYTLPTSMVELVLTAADWRSHNLGTNLPFETMLAAAERHRPKLFWISMSHIDDPDQLVSDFNDFISKRPEKTAVVVGGRALTNELREQMTFSGYCDNMRQLVEFANAVR